MINNTVRHLSCLLHSYQPRNEAVLLLALNVIQQVLAYLAEVVVNSVVVANHQRVVPLDRVLAVFGTRGVIGH